MLAVSMMGVLLLLGAALGVVAALVHAHRSAQAAADLSAIAAARSLATGGDGCGVGAGVASANDAELVACDVIGLDAWVTVRVTGPRWLGLTADPTARARAGPVGP